MPRWGKITRKIRPVGLSHQTNVSPAGQHPRVHSLRPDGLLHEMYRADSQFEHRIFLKSGLLSLARFAF
jgi:hypothetical protein